MNSNRKHILISSGKNDDAIKLYDLTTLCSDIVQDPNQNPYTIPVAMLLFRVANNIHYKKKRDADDADPEWSESLTSFYKATIYRLLIKCLELVNKQKCQRVMLQLFYKYFFLKILLIQYLILLLRTRWDQI